LTAFAPCSRIESDEDLQPAGSRRGLPEAEIVTWHVKAGDAIQVDQPLLAVETAKAVVDVPSPYTGRIAKLHAKEGDIVQTGKPLVDFDVDGEAKAPAPAAAAAPAPAARDSGTVVGNMPSSDELIVETAIVGRDRRQGSTRIKAAPAVRALAKKLGVELADVTATGKSGLMTPDDVRRAAASSSPSSTSAERSPAPAARAPAPPASAPAATHGASETATLRGTRRAMAQSMSLARDAVMECTIFDDADIQYWQPGQDITARVLRAVASGCRAEPGLNAWYDGETLARTIHERVDIAVAMDTEQGLIVPVVRDIGSKSAVQLRADVNRLKEATRKRTVTPEDMRDFTITLSNFGTMAGRYATPVVVPPTVAILGTGAIRHDVVAVMGGIEAHRRIPLSLTFDHRCCTGGEACRFLGAVIEDLQKPQ
jgi:pyruvate dehydrogenase E2 component (dihydrolipoamide acetyltransferase)